MKARMKSKQSLFRNDTPSPLGCSVRVGASWRLVLVLILAVVPGVARAAEPPVPEGRRVGDLGRREALVFEGNATFTKDQILEAMAFHVDYHAASHRAAPLSDFLARLERKIALGYLRGGFPEARVAASAEANFSRIKVVITEGPRFVCGDVLLSGAPAMTNATVKQKITDVLSGFQPGAEGPTNANLAIWFPGNPAPFDEFSIKELKGKVQQALTGLNYFQPAIKVSLDPDPARHRADLRLEIADEGIKGVIADIEVIGVRTNTPQHVLEFLKLKSGMELHPGILTSVSNALWQSGRFFYQDVSLAPLPAVGKFRLTLDLEELREAPPLHQELSPEAKALLKFHDWLQDWRQRPEDFVCSMAMTSGTLRARGDVVLSASGMALAARGDASNGAPALKYAVVATPTLEGFYSSWRGRKLVHPRAEDAANLVANIELAPDPQARTEQRFSFTFVAGSRAGEGSEQMGLEVKVAPVALVREAARLNTTIKEGVLQIQSTNVLEEGLIRFRIDVKTGRLIEGVMQDPQISAHIRTEAGAFARVLREIAATTANHPNDYVTNHGFSSWVTFMAADVMEAPFIGQLFEEWLKSIPEAERPTNILATVRQVRAGATYLRALVGQENLAHILEPLNALFPRDSDDNTETFEVPRDIMPEGVDLTLFGIATIVLGSADAMLPRDSWPWVLLRETTFTLMGMGRYTEGELERLRHAEDVGPAGCLATAMLVGRVDAKLARSFAERGLSRLSTRAFEQDYRVWMNQDAVVGQVLSNVLGLLRGLREDQVALLTAVLPSDTASFVRQVAQLVRDGAGRPAGEAAWPAVEQHWANLVSAWLETGLNHFLPQVQRLTDPKALYERGRALSGSDAFLRDLDEAAQCFAKAAEQGHGEAQLLLGLCYQNGQGVAKDYAKAMLWYVKALEQQVPHAGCRIGDLHMDGLGVPKNLEEAVRYYLPEAEGAQCHGAQSRLGRILEEKNKLPESLKWYRRAAEGGDTPAQIQLANLLSDGISTQPDYQEACQWLILAMEKEKSKMIEVDLRRLKAKLTAAQVEEAQKRADTIRDRLEAISNADAK